MFRRKFIKLISLSGALIFIQPEITLTNLLFGNTPKSFVSNKTKSIFNTLVRKAKKEKWHKLDIHQIIIKIALKFLNSPYIAGSLEGNEEACRIDFRGFDCVTMMESCLDLARIIKKQKYTLEDLISEVIYTRYREGKMIDYTSRLHYTADWIYDNIAKNVIQDKTQALGGVPIIFNVGFMSKNPDYYTSLKNDPSLIDKIKEIERIINTRTYYYIPKSQVALIENDIESGDIIAFVTSKAGLDYSHIGLAYKEKGETRLLHSSSKWKKVIIDVPIKEYIENISTNIGITILSPLNP